MLAAIMAMAVILDSHPAPDPASLVKQLGSSRYSLRVSAEGELARLGRGALPALKAAKDSKDAEIRTRSIALVAQIENSLLLQATPIGLDFQDILIPDAVEAVARQAGQPIFLSTEERPMVASRRITLRSDRPMPFWEAIDALCSAGKLHVFQGDQPASGGHGGSVMLIDGPVARTGLISIDGPFRVQLSSVHFQSEIQLDEQRATREFFLQFVLSAEPRLAVTRNGSVKVSAAVDDRGRSLLNPASFQHEAGYFGMSPSSLLRFRVDLDHPGPPAREIKALRGVVPVIVATRKPDPIVVPLAESRGKLFRSDDVALTLLEHRPASPQQPATIQVAIRALGATIEPVNHGNGEPLGYRPESFQQQMEILDAQGRLLTWFPSGTIYDGEETRLTLTVGTRGEAAVPTTLRYHGVLRANADVAFDFRDIPIP
jgi:hypothetical protein